MKLEPMKYASGVVDERAGNSLPDTSVVIMNGYNRKISNGTMAGKKGTFTIVQRLWRLEGASGVPSQRLLTAVCEMLICHDSF